jgi:serine O-acetyltransferase
MHALHRRKAFNAFDIMDLLLLESHGIQALMIYRFGRWLGRLSDYRYTSVFVLPLFPAYWILSFCVRKAYGIDLDQSADIAPGLCITHFGGIEVKNCRIGSRCNIHQQVKLGSEGISNEGLVIGEGVYIGAHAQIYADVNIGDGATIGAGTVITQDVPPHCLVLGNPSRITQQNYDNSALL